MPTQEAKEVMRQLTEVLVYLHDNGKMSGDVILFFLTTGCAQL